MINWDKIKKDYSLEDMHNLIERNRPNKNNKLYDEWASIYFDIIDELVKEDERPNECYNLINRAIEFLKKQKDLNIKGIIIPIKNAKEKVKRCKYEKQSIKKK